MASEVKTNKISPIGSTVTLGDASDVFQLPASAEIDIASGATLDVNGNIDFTGASVTGLTTGKVLQVLGAPLDTSINTTNTEYVTTGLTIDITSASTSSRFLLTLAGGESWNTTAQDVVVTTFFVGGSEVSPAGPYDVIRSEAQYEQRVPHSCFCLHSPGAAGSLTYAVFYKSDPAGTVANFNLTPTRVQFTVMELSS